MRYTLIVGLILFSSVLQGNLCSSAPRISGEYLYMLPCQAGLTYAFATEGDSLQDNPRLLDQTFDWESGGRVSAAMYVPCTCLELEGRWTGFFVGSTSVGSGQVFIAAPINFDNGVLAGGEGFGGARPLSRWDMKFSMFDFHLRYTLLDCACVRFDIYAGAKGGWIKQTQHMEFIDFTDTDSGNQTTSIVDEQSNYYGAGPQLGLEVDYALFCGIELQTVFEAAVLAGKLFSPTRYFLSQPAGFGDSTFDADVASCHALPHLRFRLALERIVCECGCFACDMSLGYEAQYFFDAYFNANTLGGTILATNAGYANLLLQGFTVGFGVRF